MYRRPALAAALRPLTFICIMVAIPVGLLGCTSSTGTPAAIGASTSSPVPTPSTSVPSAVSEPAPMPAAIERRYADLGGPGGYLGPILGPPVSVPGGAQATFTGGTLYVDRRGKVFVVQGEILNKYLATGGPAGILGLPTSDEATTDGGWISTFSHGAITVINGVAVVTPR